MLCYGVSYMRALVDNEKIGSHENHDVAYDFYCSRGTELATVYTYSAFTYEYMHECVCVRVLAHTLWLWLRDILKFHAVVECMFFAVIVSFICTYYFFPSFLRWSMLMVVSTSPNITQDTKYCIPYINRYRYIVCIYNARSWRTKHRTNFVEFPETAIQLDQRYRLNLYDKKKVRTWYLVFYTDTPGHRSFHCSSGRRLWNAFRLVTIRIKTFQRPACSLN